MNKNMKRIMSFIVSFTLICSCFHIVSAEGTDRLAKAKNLLAALDIVDDASDAVVTRERFADIYTRANNIYQKDYVGSNSFSDTEDSEYAQSIDLMRDLGIINGVGNNCFAPSENILMRDIVKLYVSALGLDAYTQKTGKDYMQAGYEVDLFDGVGISDYITMDNLILMTYNFLMAPVGEYNFTQQVSYKINYDTTALYEKFGVFKTTGQIIQNDMSGIWSSEAAAKGNVVINTGEGEFEALAGDCDIASMLGHTLDIYIYDGADDYEVVCYEKRANEKSVVIDIKDIEFDSSNNSKISYTRDGKSSVSYEKLADFPSYIINGVYYDVGQFDIKLLSTYSGQLELISTEHSDFDIVIVSAYTNYFVKNVEHYDGKMTVYDSGSNEALVLDEDTYEQMKIFYPNGAAASPFEIQAGMLLSVAKSFGTERYVRAYISDIVHEGMISGYDYDERIITLTDGTVYDMSPSCGTVGVYFDATAKLYIDKFGDVAWIDYDKTAVYSYAFMKKPFINSEEDKVMIKIVAESGKFTTMYLAEKTKIDGMPCKNPEAQLYELESVEKIDNLAAGEYPFRYRLNDDGEIREIDTPRVRSGYEEKSSFRVMASGADVICSNDKILGKQTPLSNSTVVFLIPNAASEEERDNSAFYSIGNSSLLNTGGSNTYTAFQLGDDSMYADLVIRAQTIIGTGLNHDNKLFLVDKVQKVYDEKTEEIRTRISGLEAGVEKEYFLHEKFDATKLDGIGRGDVLRFSLLNNEVTAMDKVFIYNDDTSTNTGKYHLPTGGQKASSLAQIGTSYYYSGYVMRREGKLIEILPFDLSASSQDAGVFVPNIPDWSIETRRVFQAPTKISVYDPSLGTNGQVYIGDLEDIPTYEDGGHYVKVIVRYRSRSAQEMVVLKDEYLFR